MSVPNVFAISFLRMVSLLWQRFARCRVVSRATLDFVVFFGFNFQFAVSAVELGIGGGVTEVVLAAEFGSNLVEGLFQFVELVADVDDAASGGLGELAHFAFARVAAQSVRPIKATVGAEQDVGDSIGFQSGFDGIFNFELAAFILAVGEKNHCLPANFFRQHVVGGGINGVV